MFDVLVLLDCQLGDFQVAMTGGFWVAIRELSASIRKYRDVCDTNKSITMLTQPFDKLRAVSLSNRTKS